MSKRVLIEFRTRMVVEVLDDSDEDSVNFWLNDSSYCLSNLVDQLHREVHAREGTCDCCSRAVAFYVRDAKADESAEDHGDNWKDWKPEGKP